MKKVDTIIIWVKDSRGELWATDFHGPDASKKALEEAKSLKREGSAFSFHSVSVFWK